MSTTKTTSGSFDIRIDTDDTSLIYYDTYAVATCINGQSKFELHHESYRVPPSLLRELSDVINEADRLLAEARAAVSNPQPKGRTITAFEPAPAKSKARIRFEQGVAFLNSITVEADLNERKVLAFKTSGGYFIGVKRAGVWSFYRSNSGGKTLKSWGTLADNTKRDGFAIAHLDNHTELPVYGSENPTDLYSHRVWYDGKTTVYRYIPSDDRYVAFDFDVTKDKFPVIGNFVNNTDLIPNRFEWDKDTGWQIETATNAPSSFTDAVRAYLRPAPVEYAIDTTNSMTFAETGSVPISAYHTYDPKSDITTYSYWVPTTGEWKTHRQGSGKTWQFKDQGVASPEWTTLAPDLNALVRDGNAHYNIRVINNAMAGAPVAFFKTKGNFVFSVNRNSDGNLSAFHICDGGRRVDLYRRSMTKGDSIYLPHNSALTLITLGEATRLRPGLSSLTFYTPDSRIERNGWYYSRSFTTGTRYIHRPNPVTKTWDTSEEDVGDMDDYAPINWNRDSQGLPSRWSLDTNAFNDRIEKYLASIKPALPDIILVPTEKSNGTRDIAFVAGRLAKGEPFTVITLHRNSFRSALRRIVAAGGTVPGYNPDEGLPMDENDFNFHAYNNHQYEISAAIAEQWNREDAIEAKAGVA